MSLLSYTVGSQNIEIDYVQIEIDQKPIYDSTNFQYKYTLFTPKVMGYINPALSPAIAGETDASLVEQRIRSVLMHPRGQLEIDIGNFDNLVCPLAGQQWDAAYGPIPKRCDIKSITGDQMILINYEIECALYECPSDTAGTPGRDPIGGGLQWTSHSFSDHLSLDKYWLTTRTRTGVINFNANIESGLPVNPDNFRALIVPQIPNGFQRTNSDYVVSEDRLSLKYTFVDKEVYHQPPQNCIDWEGDRKVWSDKNGVIWSQQIRVKVWGIKGTSKANLLNAAAIIIFNSFPGGSWVPDKRNTKLAQYSIADSMNENWVEMSVTQNLINNGAVNSFYGTQNSGIYNVNLDNYPGENLAQTPPSELLSLGSRGTALLTAMFDTGLAGFLNDPCLNQSILTAGIPISLQAGSYGIPATLRTAPVVGNCPSSINQLDASNGLYTHYQLKTSFHHNGNVVALPVVGSVQCAIGALAPPMMIKAIQWVATRYDQPPTMPDPAILDENSQYLGSRLFLDAPQVATDGLSPMYTASGVYYYQVLDPTQAVLAAGSLPYSNGYYQNTLYTTFSSGIIDGGNLSPQYIAGGFQANPTPYNPYGTGQSSLTTF